MPRWTVICTTPAAEFGKSIPQGGIAGRKQRKECPVVLQGGGSSSHSRWQCVWVLTVLHSRWCLERSHFFIFARLLDVKWFVIFVTIRMYLIINEVKHFFQRHMNLQYFSSVQITNIDSFRCKYVYYTLYIIY